MHNENLKQTCLTSKVQVENISKYSVLIGIDGSQPTENLHLHICFGIDVTEYNKNVQKNGCLNPSLFTVDLSNNSITDVEI
jgi:hypothetical protein